MKNQTSAFVYIVRKIITVTNKRGDAKLFPVGTVFSAKEYNALPSDYARAKCEKVEKEKTTRVRFTNEELDFGILLYLDFTKGEGHATDNPEAIATFTARFPRRSSASVNMLFCQIRALDVHAPQEGLNSQSKALVRKLYAIDPNRFPQGEAFEAQSESKLDALLADIRG